MIKIDVFLGLKASIKSIEEIANFLSNTTLSQSDYLKLFSHYLDLKSQLGLNESLLSDALKYYENNKDHQLNLIPVITHIITAALILENKELAYEFINLKINSLSIYEKYLGMIDLINFKQLTNQDYLHELVSLVNDEIPLDLKINYSLELIEYYIKQKEHQLAINVLNKLKEIDYEQKYIPYLVQVLYLIKQIKECKTLALKHIDGPLKLRVYPYLLACFLELEEYHQATILETNFDADFTLMTKEEQEFVASQLMAYYQSINNRPSVLHYESILENLTQSSPPTKRTKKTQIKEIIVPTISSAIEPAVSPKNNSLKQLENIYQLMKSYQTLANMTVLREFLRVLFISFEELVPVTNIILFSKNDQTLYHYKMDRLYDKVIDFASLENTLITKYADLENIKVINSQDLTNVIDVVNKQNFNDDLDNVLIPLSDKLLIIKLELKRSNNNLDLFTLLGQLIEIQINLINQKANLNEELRLNNAIFASNLLNTKFITDQTCYLNDALSKLFFVNKQLTTFEYLNHINPAQQAVYQKFINQAFKNFNQVTQITYQFNNVMVNERVICLKHENKNILFSVITDITNEVNENKKLANNAIIDYVTNLYNMNAFSMDLSEYLNEKSTFLMIKLPDYLSGVYAQNDLVKYFIEFAALTKNHFNIEKIYRYANYTLLLVLNFNDVRAVNKALEAFLKYIFHTLSLVLPTQEFKPLIAALRYPVSTVVKDDDKILTYLELTLTKLNTQNPNPLQSYLIYDYQFNQEERFEQNMINQIMLATNEQNLEISFKQVIDISVNKVLHYQSELVFSKLDLSPKYLVTIAKRRGQLPNLDFYHIKQVLSFLQNLYQQTNSLVKVSIPIHKETFLSHAFSTRLIGMLKEYQIPATFINIKLITDTFSISDYFDKLTELKQFSVGLETNNHLAALQFDFDILHQDLLKQAKLKQIKYLASLAKTLTEFNTKLVINNLDNKEDIARLKENGLTNIIADTYKNVLPDTIIKKVKGVKHESNLN